MMRYQAPRDEPISRLGDNLSKNCSTLVSNLKRFTAQFDTYCSLSMLNLGGLKSVIFFVLSSYEHDHCGEKLLIVSKCSGVPCITISEFLVVNNDPLTKSNREINDNRCEDNSIERIP